MGSGRPERTFADASTDRSRWPRTPPAANEDVWRTAHVSRWQAWTRCETWTTRSARITGRSASGTRHVRLETDGLGHWRVDGEAASHLVYDESGLVLDYPGIAVRAF
jgi:hypothetical protein